MNWLHHVSLAFAVSLLVLSCKPANDIGRVDDSVVTKFTWSPLEMGIEEVRAQSSAKCVLVAFTADWDLVGGPLYRKVLRDDRVEAFLTDKDVDGYIADCTTKDSIGRSAMNVYVEKASPISLGIWRIDGTIEFVRPSLTPDGIISAIETLLKSSTEQDADD